jgi:hypothetical protein
MTAAWMKSCEAAATETKTADAATSNCNSRETLDTGAAG